MGDCKGGGRVMAARALQLWTFAKDNFILFLEEAYSQKVAHFVESFNISFPYSLFLSSLLDFPLETFFPNILICSSQSMRISKARLPKGLATSRHGLRVRDLVENNVSYY